MTVHLSAPRTQYAYDLQVPLRKMVDCRTRDLHQSLLVKLNRALVRQGKSGSTALEGARSLRPFPHHPSLEGTGEMFVMLALYHCGTAASCGLITDGIFVGASLIWGPLLYCMMSQAQVDRLYSRLHELMHAILYMPLSLAIKEFDSQTSSGCVRFCRGLAHHASAASSSASGL